MSKKSKKHHSDPHTQSQPSQDGMAMQPMSNKEYLAHLRVLEGELVAMQEWVRSSGAKICIVFEGRDTAGKGGMIKAITNRLNPRVCRVVALPAPTDREKSQLYTQRYLPHLPAAGEIVIFDRSWYNRAGVERVMGFCSESEVEEFLTFVPAIERAMVESGIILLKYWLDISQDEQTKRLQSRIDDPRKIWKLSPMDLKSYSRWYDYSRARDEMIRKTSMPRAQWFVANDEVKRRGRLNVIAHILGQIPYEPLKMPKVKLPKRDESNSYDDTMTDVNWVPSSF